MLEGICEAVAAQLEVVALPLPSLQSSAFAPLIVPPVTSVEVLPLIAGLTFTEVVLPLLEKLKGIFRCPAAAAGVVLLKLAMGCVCVPLICTVVLPFPPVAPTLSGERIVVATTAGAVTLDSARKVCVAVGCVVEPVSSTSPATVVEGMSQ